MGGGGGAMGVGSDGAIGEAGGVRSHPASPPDSPHTQFSFKKWSCQIMEDKIGIIIILQVARWRGTADSGRQRGRGGQAVRLGSRQQGWLPKAARSPRLYQLYYKTMWTPLNAFNCSPYAFPFCFWPPCLPSDPAFPPVTSLPLLDLETRSSLELGGKKEAGVRAQGRGRGEAVGGEGRGRCGRGRCGRKEKLSRKKEREDNFQRKKQKKDRNLPSNIFKYFFCYLYAHPSWPELIHKLAPRGNVHPQTLLRKLQAVVRTGQSYIRPVVVQQLCMGGVLSEGESLVMRLLVRQFLLVELGVSLAGMQKYKKKQKLQLLKLGRKLYQHIISLSYS